MNLGNVEKQTSLEEENITDDIIWNEVLKILRDNKNNFVAQVANDNSDGQIVLSGKTKDLKTLSEYLKDNKFWPPVGRVDNVFGDRNLVCSCPSLQEYKEEAA